MAMTRKRAVALALVGLLLVAGGVGLVLGTLVSPLVGAGAVLFIVGLPLLAIGLRVTFK